MDVANLESATPESLNDWLSAPPPQNAEQPQEDNVPEVPGTPKKSMNELNGAVKNPSTPAKVTFKEPVMTPRPVKKKIPWKGKNILVLLPRDDERGQPGKAAKPLTGSEIERMFSSWEELGYNVRGFDLDGEEAAYQQPEGYSQSRDAWPAPEDLIRERATGSYKVTLPDLNAWRDYVNELQEAKLRALGVSFGDDEPEPSPPQQPSRQASAQYPPLPFSPPIPTSSAASNGNGPAQAFPFPGQFMPGISSAAQSPGIPSVGSPVSLAHGGHPAKFNPRQSISVPMGQSPFTPGHQASPSLAAWPMGMGRTDSPSLLNGMMSPGSPFTPDGMPGSPAFNMHQRHQSLQFPMLPHQQLAQQQPARASPRLQEVQEVEEELPSKSPSKTPEPEPKNSDDLQAEIDEAEYHLEEQMRNELEHEDYSPNVEEKKAEETVPAAEDLPPLPHSREPSVQFQAPLHFANQSGDGPVLHHPRPHSRGHSLTKNFFQEEPQQTPDTSMNQFSNEWSDEGMAQKAGEEKEEIETNPSNLGTPVQDFNLAAILQQHQHTFSNTSNPWSDAAGNQKQRRLSHESRQSHGSKPSYSKLNVNAPEFKFNPTNEFVPGGQFVFGGSANNLNSLGNDPEPPRQFQAGDDSFTHSDNSPMNHSFNASVSSQVNPAAVPFSPAHASTFSPNVPTFSPGQSDFSFSASGPKFRPDAPAFTPFGAGGMSDSFTSATGSGNESGGTRPNSIFGNINISDIIKPAKKSKAIPIIRPSSKEPGRSQDEEKVDEDADGRATNESRPKRAKANRDDGDSVPLFASPTPSPKPPTKHGESGTRSGDEEGTTPADTTMSSTSEHHDESKAVSATSPSEASQGRQTWGPFEFGSNQEMRQFSEARPFGEEPYHKGHKKSLSATAKAFVPGALSLDQQPKPESEDEEEDEREREATIEPPAHQKVISSVEPATPLAEEVKPIEKPATPPPQQALGKASRNPVEEAAELPVLRKGMGASRFASPPPKPKGLKASRFASPPKEDGGEIPEDTPKVSEQEAVPEAAEEGVEQDPMQEFTHIQDADESNIAREGSEEPEQVDREPTFEEIDAIMDHLNQNDPTMGVKKSSVEEPRLSEASPKRQISVADVPESSPLNLQPASGFKDNGRSPSPRKYQQLPNIVPPIPSTEVENPFVDPPLSAQSIDPAIQRLNRSESAVNSDWDGTFSDDEQEKLEQRVQFFDGRVNGLVGDVLNARLQPLEKALLSIERHLSSTRPSSSSRRDGRSVSAEVQLSDADDEDEEPVMRRSMSPRRDRRAEQIRHAVLDAFAVQQQAVPAVPAPEPVDNPVLKALEEMKLHLSGKPQQSDLRDMIEEVMERRMPSVTNAADGEGAEKDERDEKMSELQAKVLDLEERLYAEKTQVEKETKDRRDAEELAAELNRKLQAAETRVEVEIMNRSVWDQRTGDLEDRLKQQEARTEEEVEGRRAAEHRLSEVQRLLRIASEEETRLREVIEEREQKIKAVEQSTAKSSMRMSLLEAAQNNSTQSQSEMTNRVNILETDLREARKEAQHYKSETERAAELSQRQTYDLHNALEESKHQQRLIDTLGTQLQENERIRESWRSKFVGLQEEMTKAAHEITEENARRTKKEQVLVARQEVLDAKLQAESRTRERLETELERLENGERQGLRAISECKRLETLLGEMRTENHQLQQASMRYQREFEEARESGASEVERTRYTMQMELDQANNQIIVLRQEMDQQQNKLQAEIDQAVMDADSAKAKADMLVEEAQNTKTTEIEQLKEAHANAVEDMQTRHARQLGNTVEESQKSEQLLLERLSLSSSKTEHLQDRVSHLEEKLEIAKEAAVAAAKRAKSPAAETPRAAMSPVSAPTPAPATIDSAIASAPTPSAKPMELPEKISPQALRESIMVLQEQLQAREQQIEELEQTVEKLDPEGPAKIAKRDDEITWLRELLAVRHGDLQDIIKALSSEHYDKDAVKDAAIRLKANLQMEEQERERAMNGASAINLPSIAQTLQNASPRVAQAVGPLAAAWGNWRKAQAQQQPPKSAPGPRTARNARQTATPSKSTSSQPPNSLMGGLMTPPATGLRQTPPGSAPVSQPTAFGNTGRRLTSAELANQRSRDASVSSRQAEKMPARDSTPPRKSGDNQPETPPMQSHDYDSDAHAADFDENDFFDEED